jgi:hypothetical protein
MKDSSEVALARYGTVMTVQLEDHLEAVISYQDQD